MRALAACLSLLLLGCAPMRAPVVTFALPVAADGAGAPLGPSSTREIATSVRDGAVRLQGVARLYRAVAAANVAPDGSVAGSAVVVTDVMTGKRAAMATSFYDGSFVVDVPLADGQRAVLVTLELVERGGSHRAVVGAPALLKAGEVEHDVRVNLGTTVLPGRVVTFALGGGSSVTGTTNAQGVATATLPINGSPRNTTVTASFAQTSFYKGSSVAKNFEVTKNASATSSEVPSSAGANSCA